jgi:large subunit ribosomal protein L30
MKINEVEIELVKSPIGYPKKQKNTVIALGLKRIRHVVKRTLTPSLEGMLKKIEHLIAVRNIEK